MTGEIDSWDNLGELGVIPVVGVGVRVERVWLVVEWITNLVPPCFETMSGYTVSDTFEQGWVVKFT